MLPVVKTGLAAIIDDETEVLILGSLPGDESLAKEQYYASKRNDFWKILTAIVGFDFVNSSYSERISQLGINRIGLWDVYRCAIRNGSVDRNIEHAELNDFDALKRRAPKIRLICFNGQEAGEAAHVLSRLGYNTTILPSSSGANRRNQPARLLAWQEALDVAP